jgi:23S rRNA (uracil1939-C5)-methyltransferase
MRSRQPKAAALTVEVRIDAVTSDGFGQGLVGERTVRVKNALPGESVRARVLKRRKGEWLSEAFEVHDQSALRSKPACVSYPRCGGCAMAHISYAAQVELKEQHLLDALAQHGVQPGCLNAATVGPQFNYRTKARFGVRVVAGQTLVGFRESFSNRVGRMNACLTLVPRLSALIEPLKLLISQLSCPGRIPQIEVAAGDSSCALIIRHLEPLSALDLTRIEDFARTQNVDCFGQSAGYDSVALIASCCPAAAFGQAGVQTSAECAVETTGKDAGDSAERYLSYSNPDYGVHFLFRPMDFTQVNLTMNRQLVRAAIAGLSAPKGTRVLDLFCGIGNFSLALAASGLEVTGLESSAESIDRARLNAARNGLQARCEFAVQDLYDAGCLNPGRAPYVLLDPPRSGAGPNLQSWVRAGWVERIAYVSCSPESFAADAAVLIRAGFELEQAGIFDMFPHTAHVETLGVFQRKW